MVSRIGQYVRSRREDKLLKRLQKPPKTMHPVAVAYQAELFEQDLQAAEAQRKAMEKAIEPQLKAEEALADLEATMVTLGKEDKVKQWTKDARALFEERKTKISPEELEIYEDALDEYARKIGRLDILEAAETERLTSSLKRMKADIRSDIISDEEREARIEEFVKVARKTLKTHKKRKLANLKP